VLIHGFSGTRLIWEPVLEALERSHDVLAVNLAGHVGGPEMADTPVSVNALVDAVERDLDAAGFDTAHVVGNSLGGWIAFELATRGRARSVVALSPAGGWEPGSRAERRLRMLFTRMDPRYRVGEEVVASPVAIAAGLRDRVCRAGYLPHIDGREPPPRFAYPPSASPPRRCGSVEASSRVCLFRSTVTVPGSFTRAGCQNRRTAHRGRTATGAPLGRRRCLV
jgi:pimeloyl-ACP methyl ester carboxylesterase